MVLPLLRPPVVIRVDYSPTTSKVDVKASVTDRDVVIVALAKALYAVLADSVKLEG